MFSVYGKAEDEFADAVDMFRAGDSSSFECIYSYSVSRLRKYALYLSKDPYDADDLLQETYLRIFENIKTIRDSTAFMMWAKTIMYNLFVERYRKSLREFACEDSALFALQDANDETESPENVLLKKETSAYVDNAVETLPAKQQDAVRQYYFGYKSVKWIAERRGTTENTIKTRLFYARKSLKNALAAR